MADGIYRDVRCTTRGPVHRNRIHSLMRSKHKTVNRRFRQFGALIQRFRHSLRKHETCFRGIASLTQPMIQNGHGLFSSEIKSLDLRFLISDFYHISQEFPII